MTAPMPPSERALGNELGVKRYPCDVRNQADIDAAYRDGHKLDVLVHCLTGANLYPFVETSTTDCPQSNCLFTIARSGTVDDGRGVRS